MTNPEPLSLRAALLLALAVLFFLTCLDHGLRKDQQNTCQNTDLVECPDRLWWFAPSN